MMQDIQVGKINAVITRDLSRLGRNYVEVGNYIERVFPFLGVRYIAVTDGFDSAVQDGDLSLPLKNMVNDYYYTGKGDTASVRKAGEWNYAHVRRILTGGLLNLKTTYTYSLLIHCLQIPHRNQNIQRSFCI